jgi:hypothetical protein
MRKKAQMLVMLPDLKYYNGALHKIVIVRRFNPCDHRS